ncbi:MAG: AI-2E family transporter [Acidobacteriaceae bacterium]
MALQSENAREEAPLDLKNTPPETALDQAEQDEVLRTSIQVGTFAQIVVALGIVLTICYYAKLPLVVICASALLAFILEPLVALLERIKIPRSVGAMISLVLLLGGLYGATYLFYQRAAAFAQDLPQYSTKIRKVFNKYQKSAERLQKATESVAPAAPEDKKVVPVTVKPANPGVTGWFKDNFGTISEVLLTMTFIPFLTYFMLTWSEHMRRSTVLLFNEEHRRAAYKTLGKISNMMRGFIVANFYIAMFIAAASVTAFGFLGLPYFYFTGIISGFLSIVPYLGVLLALVPPFATGLGSLTVTHTVLIFATVLGLHLFSMNVLYPKILGKRMQLNPLVVTLALLIWGWIWGAMGLILAVPIAAAIKIVCDNVEQLRPIGNWMGEE